MYTIAPSHLVPSIISFTNSNTSFEVVVLVLTLLNWKIFNYNEIKRPFFSPNEDLTVLPNENS